MGCGKPWGKGVERSGERVLKGVLEGEGGWEGDGMRMWMSSVGEWCGDGNVMGA
jgi:hypothetical protein